MAKNYNVEIIKAEGACKNDVFELMAKNGDLNADKVTELIGKVITLNGYALTHITTSEKEFDMCYYSTTEGMISSGSEVFKNSVLEYYGKINTFKIVSIKTKKGTTYKVSPVLINNVEE